MSIKRAINSFLEERYNMRVFRDFSDEARRKFAIRRGQEPQRWIAGNGSGPIEVVAARESRPGAFAIPVGLFFE